eukprot:3909800-Pyramimonas_sp.AAC.1
MEVVRDASLHSRTEWSVAVGCLISTGVFICASPRAKGRVAAGLPRADDVCSEAPLCHSFVLGHRVPESQ